MRGDAAAMTGLYTSDATIFPERSVALSGHEAIRKYWTLPPGRRVTHHSATPTRIVVDGAHAFDYGVYEISGERDGKAWGPVRGKYVIVWRREKGGVAHGARHLEQRSGAEFLTAATTAGLSWVGTKRGRVERAAYRSSSGPGVGRSGTAKGGELTTALQSPAGQRGGGLAKCEVARPTLCERRPGQLAARTSVIEERPWVA